MLKNLLLVSFVLISSSLVAQLPFPETEGLQIGRYQMVAVPVGQHNLSVKLYLLDTANGYVWKSTTKNNWVEHDHWELQISEFQQP